MTINCVILGSVLLGFLALAVSIFHPTRPFLTGHACTAMLVGYGLYTLIVAFCVVPAEDIWTKMGLWVLAGLAHVLTQLVTYRLLAGRFPTVFRLLTGQ